MTSFESVDDLIEDAEVVDVISKGKINNRKSNKRSRPCPVLAHEKRSRDSQLIRVVFADCPREYKIITVIDLENEYQCNCR